MRTGRGFHWFVALRYLRGRSHNPKAEAPPLVDANGFPIPLPRVPLVLGGLTVFGTFTFGLVKLGSRSLLWLTGISLAVLIAAIVARYGVLTEPRPGSFLPPDPWLQRTELTGVVAGSLAVIFGTLTVLRRVFSFFSTVSIAGVWIGTMALVFVLSVMSGFESDLRSKILGSNAHIQVSREEGDFVEWEAVKARVEAVPGVVASTPFMVSEVVIAANNNYFNVIIKGIDPETIPRVTQLMDDIQCNDKPCKPADAKEVMARLEPLVDDTYDRSVPQPGAGSGSAGSGSAGSGQGSGSALDEAPPDMVEGGEPIDFSGDGDAAEPDDPPPAPPPSRGTGGTGDDGDARGRLIDLEGPAHFGGDAPDLLGLDADADAQRAHPAKPPAAEPALDDFSDGDGADLLAEDTDSDHHPDPAGADADDADTADAIDFDEDDDPTVGTMSIEPSDLAPPSRRTKSLPGVLVGRELTKQIHLWTDQEVRLVSPLSDPANPDATGTPIPFNRDYRVAGTFFTGMYEYDLKFVYVTLESLQDFLDRGDVVDGLEVRIDDPDDTAAVRGAIAKALGKEYRVQDWQELNRSLFSALKLEKIAMFLVLAIIILVASFSIVGNLVMVVVEKGKEIALLKTLGSDDRGVTWIFVTQGFFIGLIGTGLGVAYGLIGCVLAKAFGIPINPDVYYIDQLPIHIDLPSIGVIALAGLVISVGATLYPAWVAARLAPSVGLRH